MLRLYQLGMRLTHPGRAGPNQVARPGERQAQSSSTARMGQCFPGLVLLSFRGAPETELCNRTVLSVSESPSAKFGFTLRASQRFDRHRLPACRLTPPDVAS